MNTVVDEGVLVLEHVGLLQDPGPVLCLGAYLAPYTLTQPYVSLIYKGYKCFFYIPLKCSSRFTMADTYKIDTIRTIYK